MGSRNPNPVGVFFFDLVKMLIVFFFDVVQCVHFFDDVNLCGAVNMYIFLWRGVAWRTVAWRGVAWRGVWTCLFFILCSAHWFAFNEVRTADICTIP